VANESAGLPLAYFIGALWAELRAAALAKDPQLQFNVGPVNVEFTLMTHHEGGGKTGIPFWVVEAGASASIGDLTSPAPGGGDQPGRSDELKDDREDRSQAGLASSLRCRSR
jgi:Trypsin-co-occurring domain 2